MAILIRDSHDMFMIGKGKGPLTQIVKYTSISYMVLIHQTINSELP